MKRLIFLVPILIILTFTSCELFYEEPAKGNVYIVSIGISYTNDSPDVIENLSGTVADATELSNALQFWAEDSGYQTVTTYLMVQDTTAHDTTTINDSAYPSKENLYSRLDTIAASATENDLTILSYSGHGVELTGELVLALTDTSGAIDLNTMLLEQNDLLTRVAAIPGRKLLLIDSCYSGTFISDSASSLSLVYDNGIDDWYDQYYSSDSYEVPKIMILTASAHTDSYEQTIDGRTHGVFSNTLLAGLGWEHDDTLSTGGTVVTTIPPASNHKVLSVDSLYEYVKENQTLPVRWSIFDPSLYLQHPMVTGGALDMTLFTF